MSIEAIAALDSSFALQASAALAPRRNDGVFRSLVDALGNINEQMHANDKAVQVLALGEAGNLQEVMMNLEKTRLTFELALQVRNKTLEAYQELMRMQV